MGTYDFLPSEWFGLLSKAIRKGSGCRTFICFKSVSSSKEKIFPKAQQIKSLPPLNCGQSATLVEGRANSKNPFYSAWNLFKLGFTAFGDPTCRVTKLHFMSSRCLILPVSITPDDKNKHR
ncbi:hypothetical protein AVEN_212820-1 [Araneus ventricosus]|uniref:Uncharacterized protein n=1 Tax=Araneus ventricosus TaxID=182803 RepID=A0A4Y2SLV6_ARAVE|nr:hypothetical protein AVEN_212820-1 [Araneus ventricosus]